MAAFAAGTVLLAGALLHLCVVVRRLWRDPAQAERLALALSVMAVGPAARRGTVRGMATLNAMLLSMGVFLTAVGSWELDGGAAMGPVLKTVLRVSLVGFLVLFAAHLSTIWFNFPRFLAPVHMRGDEGLVTAALRKRRKPGNSQRAAARRERGER
ncbi:hypothetical protein [Kitasatospora phosalacinea]|uniref:Uncharacterized protein n=1 Tax=Kitasatospora phosalacinea TaxID=2065 RepID=A0A9W6UNQ9_9ACTN|nr:hypothetical protein [Kitasatospora phosalacinea]GLW55124.1 hypothetical protein Kpho01_31350 [Kitasatospora phosalacinea]